MASACSRRARRAATAGSCSSASVSANNDRAPSGVRSSWLMLATKSRRTSSSRRRSVTSSTTTSTSPEPSPSGWAASSNVSRGGPARSTRRVTVRPPSGRSPLGRSPSGGPCPADPRPASADARRPGPQRQSAGARLHQGVAVAGLQVALAGRVGRPQLVVGVQQQQRLGQPVEHGAQAPGSAPPLPRARSTLPGRPLRRWSDAGPERAAIAAHDHDASGQGQDDQGTARHAQRGAHRSERRARDRRRAAVAAPAPGPPRRGAAGSRRS